MSANAGVEASLAQFLRLSRSLTDASIRQVCEAEQWVAPHVLSQLMAGSASLSPSGQSDRLLPQLIKTASVPEGALFDAIASRSDISRLSREQLHALWASRERDLSAFSIWPSSRWCSEQRLVIGVDADDADLSFVIAASAPLGPQAMEVLSRCVNAASRPVHIALALPSDMQAVQERSLGVPTQMGSKSDLAHLRELAEEGPIIELVNQVLSRAVTLRASDVHAEPKDAGFAVRVRVDGHMQLLDSYLQQSYEAFVCRVKILAELDIAERRVPQDGRIDARINGEQFDVRVSIIPAVGGESMVLRLLRQERSVRSLGDLGFSAADAKRFEAWARLPNGIVLVTGPTGSGKSTTLYTALELSKRSAEKIITVEDPVEYRIADITQIQVHEEIGLTFAAALRSVLRHDPDVVLVGEIRDVETAKIAVQAALTGHLVLSTLHTNSAEGAITRLLDMGVDAFLLADSLRAVLAQRLVRRVCKSCAQPDPQRQAEIESQPPAHLQPVIQSMAATGQALRLMRPVGCERCQYTGYLGRIAVFDLLDIDAELRGLIKPGVSAVRVLEHRRAQAKEHAAAENAKTPWFHAWHTALTGTTTLDEVQLIVNTND